jgi:putative inorganic carbon (HCO3(-)) transporter
MIQTLKLRWLYGISALFIILNVVFIANEFFWFPLIPGALLIIVLAIYHIDILMLIIVFFTPLAINLRNPEFNVGLSLPVEPLMFGLMLIFFAKLIYERSFDKRILYHPVTIFLIINLIWMFITCISSTMPIVSFKAFLSRLWFVTSFYFLGTQLFMNYKNIKKFIWLYVSSLVLIIGYTIFRHHQFQFSEKSAIWVMSPFYNDHTAYAAVICLFLPVFIGFIFDKKYTAITRIIAFLITSLFAVALFLSYTRAAWIGISVALVVYFIFLFRIKMSVILTGMGMAIILFFVFESKIMMRLEKNHQDSSTDISKHVESISNISTDASNVERINRWNCAIRMFKVKPILGWGPGTYSFKYAPFQHSREKTIISTNAGDKGNAHSEYLQPLADSGLIGSLSFILIVIAVIYRSSRLYIRAKDKEIRILTLGLLLGLITYFVHGIMNDFLDTDKLSVPFWGFLAILVSLDVYHSKKEDTKTSI